MLAEQLNNNFSKNANNKHLINLDPVPLLFYSLIIGVIQGMLVIVGSYLLKTNQGMNFVSKLLMIINQMILLNNKESQKRVVMCIRLKGQFYLTELRLLALKGCFLGDYLCLGLLEILKQNYQNIMEFQVLL